MAFSEPQTRALKAKLRRRHVKTRSAHGASFAYIEGWHAIAEANRIFGFENWDRRTLNPHCLWSRDIQGRCACFYQTKVRITVRAGDLAVSREGIGTGYACEHAAEVAHDLALKAAETDATKRALATFGNVFGLALYDREQAHVTKGPKPGAKGLLVLCRNDQSKIRFASALDFLTAARREVDQQHSVDSIYEFWAANLSALAQLSASECGREGAEQLIEHIKQRLRNFIPRAAVPSSPSAEPSTTAFLIPKEKRIRDPQHLAFVRTQPCLICGRRPVHAHHLRFAQPRGMGL